MTWKQDETKRREMMRRVTKEIFRCLRKASGNGLLAPDWEEIEKADIFLLGVLCGRVPELMESLKRHYQKRYGVEMPVADGPDGINMYYMIEDDMTRQEVGK